VSCDAPVKQRGEGFVKPSIEYINTYLDHKESMFGSLFGKIAVHTIGNGATYSIDNLVSDLSADIAGI
jgi:CRISPR system Cascade subunit CasC